MSVSTCWSCRCLLRQRLHAHIAFLQQSRRCASTNARPSLSWYNDTTAPTPIQLEAAEKFFLTHKPRRLWTATEWRKHNDTETTSIGLIPEVAFLGRSNVGKSSLLNALLLSPALNHVGPRPGKTTTMHAWAVSPSDPKSGGATTGMKGDMGTKCAVLDMPGYGHASHDDWGEEILSYLKNRKQLKRAFVLVDGRHGLKDGDLTMLRLLKKQGVSAQIVVSKCDKTGKTEGKQVVDKLWMDVQQRVKGPGLGLLGEVIVVGALGDGRKNEKVHYNDMRGVHEVQWAVLRATGLDEYAMSLTPQGSKAASTSTLQTKKEASLPIESKEVLQAETRNALSTNILTKFHDLQTQSQPQAHAQLQSQAEPQPQSQPNLRPESPFSWPAKIRQPPSSISDAGSNPRSPPAATMKSMIPPASVAELPMDDVANRFEDHLSIVSEKQLIDNRMSMGSKTHVATPNARFERTKQNLVVNGMLNVKGRQVVNYKENSQMTAEVVGRQPSEKSAVWTGSAVGGMADLEAMMKRTSRPASGGRKPVKTNSAARGRQSVQHSEQSSHEVLAKQDRPKEVWTGSAVGGMADLEDMMARTARPASGGERSVKKPMKRRRY